MAAGTPVQAAAGYPGDTADAFFDHYLTFNRWAVDPAIARRFCDAALPTFEWLVGLGVRFTPEGLYRATREPVPRSHRPVGGGQAYVDALHRAVRSHGVDIALRRRVDSLVPGGEGTGYTIGAGGDEMTARSVVLATGGSGPTRTWCGGISRTHRARCGLPRRRPAGATASNWPPPRAPRPAVSTTATCCSRPVSYGTSSPSCHPGCSWSADTAAGSSTRAPPTPW